MIVWQSPVISYWCAVSGLRQPSMSPAVRDRCLCALIELAQRSDAVGQRARETLLDLHRSGRIEAREPKRL
jgi:hypothetical protein